MLAAARERGVTAVVMEVSSHALAMGRVGGVRFAVGGYTNFGSDHLDFHADTDDYFAAKAQLFDGRCAVEVVNLDDPALRPLCRPARSPTRRPATRPPPGGPPTSTGDGYAQRFTAHGPDGWSAGRGGAAGRHNVANALLPIAALVAVGVDPAVAAAGVAACAGRAGPAGAGRRARAGARRGRLRAQAGRDRGGAGRAARAGRRRPVDLCDRRRRGPGPGQAAGDGRGRRGGSRPGAGDRRQPAYRGPGGDPGRGAAPGAYGGRRRRPDHRGGRPAGRDRRGGRLAEPGDVIALLGKGHERGQEVAGEVLPFDDRVELADALRARFGDLAGQR